MRRKYFFIILLVAFLFISGCRKNDEDKNDNNNNQNEEEETEEKANTNPGIVDRQELGNVIIEQTSLVYNDGISTLTTSIRNNGTDGVLINSIDIIFKDENDNVIISILGYIGETIKPNDNKILVSSVDQDLSGAIKVDYKIND